MNLVAAFFTIWDKIDLNALKVDDILTLIGNFIRLGLFFAGILSVVFVVVGAFQMITSSGNPQALVKARQTLTYAIAGLIVSIMAVGIVDFIIDKLK